MRTSLLLAASIATLFAFASLDRAAVAQGQPGAKSTAKPTAATKAAPRRTAARKRTKASGFLPGKAARKGPGQCGTFMYWKGGKCVDARLPKK
jgi:hypothetical protein